MRARLVAVLIVLATALCFSPSTASAQCFYACTCSQIGCKCGTGGNGSSCDATGNSCEVMRCTIKLPEQGFAADGAVLNLADAAPRLFAAGKGKAARKGPRSTAPASPAAWEAIGPGHAVARRCDGVIVAHAWEPDAAAAARERSRKITI